MKKPLFYFFLCALVAATAVGAIHGPRIVKGLLWQQNGSTLSPTDSSANVSMVRTSVAQINDTSGITVTGYDDLDGVDLDFYVDQYGAGVIDTTAAGTLAGSGTKVFRWDSAGTRAFDDKKINFGNSDDYWQIYNTTGTQWELWTTNADGGGTDGLVISIDDGTDDVDFSGDIVVTGDVGGGSKSFLIDHPLSPTTRTLRHNTIESARAVVQYFGKVTLSGGTATVNIDTSQGLTAGTYHALTARGGVTSLQPLNSFERVKCTAINAGANFTITSEDAGSTTIVLWTVTAEREDNYIKSQPWTDGDGVLIPEADKPAMPTGLLDPRTEYTTDPAQVGSYQEPVRVIRYSGYYRHPDAYGQTQEVTRTVNVVLQVATAKVTKAVDLAYSRQATQR